MVWRILLTNYLWIHDLGQVCFLGGVEKKKTVSKWGDISRPESQKVDLVWSFFHTEGSSVDILLERDLSGNGCHMSKSVQVVCLEQPKVIFSQVFYYWLCRQCSSFAGWYLPLQDSVVSYLVSRACRYKLRTNVMRAVYSLHSQTFKLLSLMQCIMLLSFPSWQKLVCLSVSCFQEQCGTCLSTIWHNCCGYECPTSVAWSLVCGEDDHHYLHGYPSSSLWCLSMFLSGKSCDPGVGFYCSQLCLPALLSHSSELSWTNGKLLVCADCACLRE